MQHPPHTTTTTRATSASPSAAFFHQHKDLFDFDAFVGGVLSASTPSFLDRYRECERARAAELAHIEPRLYVMSASLGVQPSPPPVFQLPTDTMPRVSMAPCAPPFSFVPPKSPVRHAAARLLDLQLRSPMLRRGEYRATPFDATDSPYERLSPQSRTSQPRIVSPKRALMSTAPVSHREKLPRVSDLLIDASTRAVLLGPAKRVDEATKIELLIGSKCVGRVSTAATSNLPPAIRRRLQASAAVHQRRERLYAVLRDEYARLME